MFRDPKLRKLFIVLALGYATLIGAFILSTEKKAPPQSLSQGAADSNASKSTVNVRMKSAKPQSSEPEKAAAEASVNLASKNAKKVFYKDGKVSAEWMPNEKKKGSGDFKAFYPNGTLWFEAEVAGGRFEGISRAYYPDGVLWTVSNFKNGAETGISQFFYPSTKPWIEMSIEKGVSKGLPAFYSESGQLRKPPPVSDRDGNKYFKVLDPTGDLVTQWVQTPGGEESTITTFYETGEKSSKWIVLNGALQGSAKIFYPGEAVWREYIFEAGRMSAGVKTYYSNGTIWTETKFVGTAGLISVRGYYPSGVLWFVMDPHIPQTDQPIGFFSESYAGGKSPSPSHKKTGSG